MVPLTLGERQVVTLEFTRPVAKLGVTDADALRLEPSGTRLKVTALRAGRTQVEVSFDDGATLAWDVTVVAPRKPARAAAAARPGELELVRRGGAQGRRPGAGARPLRGERRGQGAARVGGGGAHRHRGRPGLGGAGGRGGEADHADGAREAVAAMRLRRRHQAAGADATRYGPPVPTLTLIDGSGFVFRAYHALPPLTDHARGCPPTRCSASPTCCSGPARARARPTWRWCSTSPARASAPSSTPPTRPTGRRRRRTWSRSSRWCGRWRGPSTWPCWSRRGSRPTTSSPPWRPTPAATAGRWWWSPATRTSPSWWTTG